MASTTDVLLICRLVLFVLLAPVYIYGWYAWNKLSYHFVIRSRFPRLCAIIIILCFIISTWKIVVEVLYYQLSIISETTYIYMFTLLLPFIYWSVGLIFFRVLLIYKSWYSTQQKLIVIFNIDTDTDSNSIMIDQHNPNKLDCKSICYLLYLSISSVIVYIFAVIGQYKLSMLFWFILLCIGSTFVAVTICKKVKEGIGCIAECYIFMITFLVYLLINMLSELTHEDTKVIMWPMVNFQALFILYTPIILIYRSENKINTNISIKTTKLNLQNVSTNSINIDVNNPSNDIDADIDKTVKEEMKINLALPIIEFLKEYHHYQVFVEYLAYCFAVENIMFLERICIIYHIMTKCLSVDNQQQNNIIYQLKFDYLQQHYSAYKKILDKALNSDDNTFENYRDEFCCMFTKICNDYIADGSTLQVNVSDSTKNSLLLLFETGENYNKIQSYDDLLNVWDDAMLEIYRLLSSIFGYRFKSFVIKNYPNRYIGYN